MAINLNKKYIVRITIWGQWFDTLPMTIANAEAVVKAAKDDYPDINISILEA